MKRRHASLADAKTAHPAAMRLLLDHDGVIEYWDRGRARTVVVEDAPPSEAVLACVLRAHRRRFRRAAQADVPATNGEPKRETTALVTVPPRPVPGSPALGASRPSKAQRTRSAWVINSLTFGKVSRSA
jgi:hypothetical protein